MSNFIISGYVSHEDCMYNRKLGLGEKKSINSAVEEAQYHKKYGKYYQTMVHRDDKLLVACRSDRTSRNVKTYKFFYGDVFKKIEDAVRMLSSSISADWGMMDEYVLYDADGKVNIDKVVGSRRETKYNDVLGQSFNWVQNYAEKLINIVSVEMVKPVHSIYVNPSFHGNCLYVLPSEVEKGSIDIHIDWF